MNVSNNKCIRRLSAKSMWASRGRNLIAVIAIALTTILFTSLFTVILSANHAFQQANFRQAGGYAHGSFKYLSREQADELKNDPLIREYGLRLMVGFAEDEPFNKSHVEVSYCDSNTAKWWYALPTEGRLPQEGTNEAATDTRVLSLLGIEPKLGVEFVIPIVVDGVKTSETFILCGWWEYDEAITASSVLIPQSRAESILSKLGTQGIDGITGTWGLEVMLASSMHIEQDLRTILANHGYQCDSKSEENFIDIGVNWGYTGAQMSSQMDPMTVFFVAALLLIIIFTGYLIIYNVFQISVSGDIRHYGLLKTIGTTGRQIKKIIRLQALRLSVIGIPIGLLAGYGVGAVLAPVIFSQLNGYRTDALSMNPLIFVFSSVFSLVTIFISCRKPGKTASKVSPVEAVRYTEAGTEKRKTRKAAVGASLSKMASANLGRSRRKTGVTIISLSLAVVLLNLTVTFVNGFDMDKYLEDVVADYLVSDASYFQVVGSHWGAEDALSEEIIGQINMQEGIINSGRIYGLTTPVQEFITEEYCRQKWERRTGGDELESSIVAGYERTEDGHLVDDAQLYGMEEYALSKLRLIEGDLSKLHVPGGRYVAAVYYEDDYGNPEMDTNWAQLGDIITLRYVDEFDYIDPVTGEILDEIPEDGYFDTRAKEYRDVEYEVAALITVPNTISYRYYGSDEFVMNDKTFIEATGTSDVMLYAFDTTDEADADMEIFLRDFTGNIQTQLDYESKLTYAEEFYSFQNMFLMLGSLLCFIVGLIGVLNFLNAVLTGILARRREFAVLQAVGMTGRQLKSMLVWEGLYYTLGSALASLLLCIATAPLLNMVLSRVFWFFSYHFTILPVFIIIPLFAVLGAILPLIAYRYVAKRPVVERLREVES